MKKYIYTIVALAAMLASCSQDAELNQVVDNQEEGITQVCPSTEATTRAAVDATDNTKVIWQLYDNVNNIDADALSVFGKLKNESGYSAAGGSMFSVISTGTNGSTGTFVREEMVDYPELSTITAMMYPYQATATWDNTNKKLTCEIPAVQTPTKGSFDRKASIMYNIGSETAPVLRFAVNFLKVTVTETNVHSICISSSAPIAGKMDITSSAITPVAGATLNNVALVAGEFGVLEPGDYYIAVKLGDIPSPAISYTYYNDNHRATVKTKEGASDITFARYKNVMPVSVDFSTGTVTTRNAIQLDTNGPYFAEFNVGSTITDYAQATGCYDSHYGDSNVMGGLYGWGCLTDVRQQSEDIIFDLFQGTVDSQNLTLPIYNDVASASWGANWKTPTNDDLTNLLTGKLPVGGSLYEIWEYEFRTYQNSTLHCNYVDWKWCRDTIGCRYVDDCRLPGFKITSKVNGYAENHIFLPYTGYRQYGHPISELSFCKGCYWTATCNGSTGTPPYNVTFFYDYTYNGKRLQFGWTYLDNAFNSNVDNGGQAYAVRAVLR